MSAIASTGPDGAAAMPSARHRVETVARVERHKLTAQLPLRVLAIACLLGPFAFAVLLKIQSGTPSDALYGSWVHSSGFALSLVVLGFAANWGFPIIAGVLAGDLFASEDRHGTWKTILTRSRSLSDVFAGKVLSAMTFALILGVLVAVSSLLAGLMLVGGQRLVDFAGNELAPAHVLLLVILSWLICLLPVLAYTCLAVLFSVATRNGIFGVLGPILVALVTQLLALIGTGTWVHLLLIGSAFDAWHGLFAGHLFAGPLIVSTIVCLAWIALALGASWHILHRRAFVAESGLGRVSWKTSARIVIAGLSVIALLALASNWGPAGVTSRRLTASFASEFHRLTVLQQDRLGHPIPASARYRVVPVCNHRGAKPVGPGEWTCTMNVFIVLAQGTQPLTNTPVAYDVSVQSNGCYKAAAPPGIVGPAEIRDTSGHSVVNPLTIIYGCFNIL